MRQDLATVDDKLFLLDLDLVLPHREFRDVG